MIIRLLFSCILTLELICTAMVIFSMLQPEKKIWPPKEEDSPGGILMQALFNLTAVGIILLGILDWGKTVLPVLVRILGGLTWLAGMALAVWAVICLGVKNTLEKCQG